MYLLKSFSPIEIIDAANIHATDVIEINFKNADVLL